MEVWFLVAAIAVSICGACFDVVSARIPNQLTYSAMLVALVAHLALHGWRGLLDGVGGLLFGGGIFLVFFAIHAMGGGDVKMMATVGAWVGFSNTGEALIASSICGGIMAIGYMLVLGRFRTTMRNVGSLLQFHSVSGAEVHPELNLSNPEAVRMPYGVAIALGSVIVLCTTIWKG